MILYEFEGKKLLEQAGIKVPRSELIDKDSIGRLGDLQNDKGWVLKAQVLSGKRADSGGIIFADDIENCKLEIENLFGKTINGEEVKKILVEEKIDVDKQYYVSISYDIDTRGPVLTVSEEGGTGIESRKVTTHKINPLHPTNNLPKTIDSALLKQAITLFFEQDCLLLEINPLVRVKESGSQRISWIALDAKIKLDDDARSRHTEWDFPPRGIPGRLPTKREIEAKKIDEGDYRGVAGSTFFDLDGDIAVLSSGGGVSLTAMDALLNFGGKPANFTEYSGNPPKEKVVKLTKIVLDKPNIHGLWVIGTVAANFTDIYETLSGIIEGLRVAQEQSNTKFKFPIVIRRGGPREKEAYEMLKKVKDFYPDLIGVNLILQGEETSITSSARIMARLAAKRAEEAEEYEGSMSS